MSYIITDDKHYKNIANAIRSKLNTDEEYYPEDMAPAITKIPSSADGTSDPAFGIYFLNPDEDGYATECKVIGWKQQNLETIFPINFQSSGSEKMFSKLQSIDFIDCEFKYFFDGAFQDCSSLKSINIPESITSIGNSTFYGCSSLKSINIPESVKSIGSYAFYNCISLTSINIPDGVKSIGYNTLSGCSSLKSINIPNSVTLIDVQAFFYCSSLKSINIPNSVINIGSMAFTYCVGLEDVSLGDEFNADNLDLSSSTLYARETILQWLNALADRTGQTAYKLSIGATNLAKLTEDDILIATNKNWTLA